MLPASQTANPPGRSKATVNWRMMAVVIALLLYTILVGWGLFAGTIKPGGDYLLMVLPCLVPAAWYSYGFVKVADAEQDFGLLLSAVGWILVVLSLLIKHRAVSQAMLDGIMRPNEDRSSAALVCAALAVLCLLIGAALSWHAWVREIKNSS